jgi:hypothetical protein
MSETQTLIETFDCRGLTLPIDAQAGTIKGVKILGTESRNGRSYPAQTLKDAAPLYEGAKVNVNHPRGPADGPRDYQDRLGVIRNVAVREDGLYGDLCFNPKHAIAEQLGWDAAHAPENLGLSHNVAAAVKRQGDKTVVEKITRVNSVDLVADPATTKSLFEATGTQEKPLDKLTLADLHQHRPDLVEQIHEDMARELDTLRGHLATAQRREFIRRMMADRHMTEALTQPFLEVLLAAKDEATVTALIEDRAALARQAATHRAQSQAQGQAAAPITPKDFAAEIRG